MVNFHPSSSITVLVFNCCSVIFVPQRSVSSLSEGVAVCSLCAGTLRSSVTAAAPAGLGPALSAHTGHTHCWLPPGATGWHGQVQRTYMD